jgi:hypothetical protein
MLTVVSEVCTASIIREMMMGALMMDAVCTSETSINIYLTTSRKTLNLILGAVGT